MNYRYESIRKLVCDVCGGNITMQAGGQVGICSCCGLNYSLDRMREIVSGIKVSQTGSAEDVEQWRELVKKYMDVGAFSDAENIVKKILEALPNDPQANEQYDELQNLKFFDIRDGVLVKYNGKATRIKIPSAVKEIRDDAFGGVLDRDNRLEEIIFSEGCEIIDGDGFRGAFADQRQLKYVKLPKSLRIIGDNAFRNCISLLDVEFPAGLQKIGRDAFAYCDSLEEVRLPENLQELESEAFRSCKLLKKVLLPNKLKTIKAGSFEDCTALENVSFPSELQTIESKAFSCCSALTNLDLPESLRTIGWETFSHCKSLVKVRFPDCIQAINNGAFFHCSSLSTIQCPNPEKFLEAFRIGTKWYESYKQQKLNEGVCPECGGSLNIFGSRCKKCGKQY